MEQRTLSVQGKSVVRKGFIFAFLGLLEVAEENELTLLFQIISGKFMLKDCSELSPDTNGILNLHHE